MVELTEEQAEAVYRALKISVEMETAEDLAEALTAQEEALAIMESVRATA